MSLSRVFVPSLGRSLARLMAAPSSSDAASHVPGLEAYLDLGGDSLHLHGEGEETHSKKAAGDWLRHKDLRRSVFLATQICHEGWNEVESRPIVRFDGSSVHEDIDADLRHVGTESIDLVYLDDNPSYSFEPVLDALMEECSRGRIAFVGARNWMPERLTAAHSYLQSAGHQGISALFTTELAVMNPTQPLWPEYVPFDEHLKTTVQNLGLAVFAHVDDLATGQCMFGDSDDMSRFRPYWVERWQAPENEKVVSEIRKRAGSLGRTPRELNVGAILNQPFPTIGIVGLPSLLSERQADFVRATLSL